ncbi:MAG TPA: MobA/MobL family protein [Faecalibacterium prausnitzii]|nr:MobA/MobL family protein [Faecalibacterium prausnitzii]
MPVPHFNIKITQRSKGNSAVAGAAYQAGEKLFSEYDQKTKNYTCKKEVVYTEIMLPPNAPPEYADRATLWNSVEEIEKQWNSQLARRFVAALPREVPMELLPQMVKEYCEEQFVSKGMCCDFAIHDPDPPGHNPHCHFMLTMRAIDENGKWMPKSRKVYDLDENGERIKLPSGRWKSHKEDTVDWNEQYHAEEWRHGWEIVQNKYLELAGSPERIDMRSYERQGLDIIPTVHMGTAVSALERKGIATNIGNLNRDIKAANRMMNAIRSTIKSLRDWIADILEATKEVIAENSGKWIQGFCRDEQQNLEKERIAGTTDYDELVAGNGIVLLQERADLYDIEAALGDTVEVDYKTESGQIRTKAYTVMGIVNEYSYSGFSKCFALPEQFMNEATGIDCTGTISVITDMKKYDTVEAALNQLIDGNSDLVMETIKESITYYSGLQQLSFGVLLIVAVIVVCFSLINLVNTTITNFLSRRQEIGMLQAIGLSKKQLIKMLCYEGLMYSVFATLVTLVLGTGLGFLSVQVVVKTMNPYFYYSFPWLIVLIYLAILLIVQFTLISYTTGNLKKQSLVEQIRTME